jgi:hypothetical protein
MPVGIALATSGYVVTHSARDDQVAVVGEVDLAQRLDADDRDRGEQSECRAAQHRVRDRRHDRGHLGQETQDDHDDARGGDHPAALHAGKSHQADVLGERGVRERVEDTADRGGRAVGAEHVADVGGLDPLADDLAGRHGAARGLDRGDQQDDDHHDARDEAELGHAEQEWQGEPDRAGRADLVEVHVAEREGHCAADHQAEQYRDGGDEAAEDALDGNDDRDGAERVEQPADVGGVVLVGVRIGDGVARPDRDEAQSDDRDEGAGHHRREVPQQLDEDRRDRKGGGARDDHRPVDVEEAGRAAAVGQPDRDDRRHARKGHAL